MNTLADAEMKRASYNQNTVVHIENVGTPALSEASNINNLDHNLTKILKRKLRKFYGKLEEWKSFSHWFQSHVRDRVGISNSTRMSFLQDTLLNDGTLRTN